MPQSRPVSPSALAAVASVLVLMLGAAPAHAETDDDAHLRQLAGQAESYAGEVRSLLAKGADPNAPGSDGRTAVHGAAEISAAETMQALLDAGGDPDRQDRDGNTPLHLASAAPLLSGAVATIWLLLRAEADPGIANGEGRTALHLVASHHEQPRAVEALLAHGADANRRDSWGATALHAAVGPNPGWPGRSGAGLPGIVGALLAGGADPRLENGDGLPALNLFVRQGIGSGETAALLIEAGADPDRRYPNGEAPLHAAVRTGGKVAVAEALLAAGADPCIRDAEGFYPYAIATVGSPIHRTLDRAGGHDLACQGQGQVAALGSDELRRVQEALAAAGFDPGPADGEFGPRTRGAIEGWQQANGYAATGELTDTQVEALLAVAPLEPFGPGWIVAENQPCRLRNHFLEFGETVTWTGPCVDGKASGEGRLTASGDFGFTYEGSMRDGRRHGHATQTWVDGTRYEGEWRDGNQHGQGTTTYASGHRYEGEWRDGMWHGHGAMTLPSGTRYEGEWRGGWEHGHGTLTWANGGTMTCEWRDGERVDGTCSQSQEASGHGQMDEEDMSASAAPEEEAGGQGRTESKVVTLEGFSSSNIFIGPGMQAGTHVVGAEEFTFELPQEKGRCHSIVVSAIATCLEWHGRWDNSIGDEERQCATHFKDEAMQKCGLTPEDDPHTFGVDYWSWPP